VHVAEVVERIGFVIPVAEFPAEIEGSLIAGDGLLVAAELVMDVAKAVPGALFPVAFPKVLDRGQSLLAVGEGFLVVAEFGVTVADVIKDHHLPGLVSGGTVQVEGSQRVAERFGGTPQPTSNQAKLAVYCRLANVITDLFEQL
jgi:hypothetical protein